MKTLAFAVALLVPSVAAAQDQAAIDKAIRRGIEYLKTAGSPGHEHSGAKHSDELILLTFIHAEVPESDPKFKALLERVLTDEPAQTYKVALQAMCLEELQRVKYQGRIAQCAQFLVDNQCQNGQWTYGDPTTYPKDLPSVDVKQEVASGNQPKKPGVLDFSKTGPRPKPKVVRQISIKKQKDGPASGDNSNTQYAALGLRACYDAGIMIEESVIQRAVKWLLESQHPPEDGAAANAVASGGDARPRGWNYKLPEGEDAKAYGSMTAGAVGCLTIYDYMLKRDWKRNPAVNSGLAWLAKHYSVTDNPGRGGSWYRYYLYGLERAGILYDTQKIGTHDWYAEGAKALLAQQDPNGAWDKEWDTCFAILFLKKATRPLVATEAKR
jgi:hypothetical protein